MRCAEVYINILFYSDREDELRAKQLEEEIAEGRRRRQALRQRHKRPESIDKSANAEKTPSSVEEEQQPNKEQEIRNTIETLVGPTGRMKLGDKEETEKSTSLSLNQQDSGEIKKPLQKTATPWKEEVKRGLKNESPTERPTLDPAAIVKKHPAPPPPAGKKEDKATTTSTPTSPVEKKTPSAKPSNGLASPFTPPKPHESEQQSPSTSSNPRIKEISGSLSGLRSSKPQQLSPVNLEDKDDTPKSQKRVVSGPKPPVAPKPRNLTPMKHEAPEKEEESTTSPAPTYSYKSPISGGQGFHKSKSLSVSSVSLPPTTSTATETTPPQNVTATSPTHESGSGSSGKLSRSPTRVGFVQSAMLRREGSVLNKSPTNTPSASALSRSSTSASATNSPFNRSSFHSRNGSSPSVHYPNLSHPSSEHLRMSSSVSNGSINSLSSSSSSDTNNNESIRPSARSMNSNNQSPNNDDSRRWSPVRQQSWLESALKKTGPPTPEQGLVRAGTLARSSSRSPIKQQNSGGANLQPISSTSSPERKPSQLNTPDSELATKYKDTPSPSPLNRSNTLKPSPGPKPSDNKPQTESPSSQKEKEIPPFLARSNTLKPTPPKPKTEKPPAEAIDRLRSLRATKPVRPEKHDEAKETLEKAKAGLRRSNTVQHQSSDQVTERLLAAKNSLRSSVYGKNSAPILEENEESSEQKDPAEEANSFADSLEKALGSGAPSNTSSPGVKKAKTFDSSELFSPKQQQTGKKLSHITKGRAKGPKRRLPTSAKNSIHALSSSPSDSALNVPKQRNPSSSTTGTNKPTIRSPSRNVSSKRSPSGKKPPPKPRTPSSAIKINNNNE